MGGKFLYMDTVHSGSKCKQYVQQNYGNNLPAYLTHKKYVSEFVS